MAGKATGYGNLSTARNVFSVNFSTALSSLVRYGAYDNDHTFPALGALTSSGYTIFIGTAGNSNKPMIGLIDTTNAAPSSDWFPASATGGSANPNRLKGLTSYVTQAGAIRDGSSNTRITYNMAVEVPSDATTSSTMSFDLVFFYTYTGAAPDVTHAYNSGTEGSPTWTTITPGSGHQGVVHTRAGSGVGNGFYANIPASSVEKTAEGWIITAAEKAAG